MKEIRGAGAGSHMSYVRRPGNLSGCDGDTGCTCDGGVCTSDGYCFCDTLCAGRSGPFQTKEVYKYRLSTVRFDEGLESQFRLRLAERLPNL